MMKNFVSEVNSNIKSKKNNQKKKWLKHTFFSEDN